MKSSHLSDDDGSEQRRSARHIKEEVIFIEVLGLRNDDQKISILQGCTKDLSAEGLQIRAKTAFMVGTILELIISFEDGGYKFLIAGQVKWSNPLPDGDYLAGFEIIEAEHSDFIQWQNMFEI